MAKAPFTPDVAVTDVIQAYMNDEMIAEMAIPVIQVPTKTYEYTKIDPKKAFTTTRTEVGRYGSPNRLSTGAETAASVCKDYAIDVPVPLSDMRQATRAYNPLANAGELAMATVTLDIELRAAELLMTPAPYSAISHTEVLAGAAQFSDPSSDPVDRLLGIMNDLLVRPNAIVMGAEAWHAFRTNPQTAKYYNANEGDRALVSQQWAMSALQLEHMYVGRAWANMESPGQPMQRQRVWGDSILLYYKNPNPSTRMGSTLAWIAEFGNRIAMQIPDPNGGGAEGTETIRAGRRLDFHMADPSMGYLIQDVAA